MNKVYLCLGGNKGNVMQTFCEVIKSINNSVGEVSKVSSVYKTAAWGDETQEDYLNQVIEVQTDLLPLQLLEVCLAIEKKYGRHRDLDNQWASRTIDIDVLLFNNEQIVEKKLIIPHPRMLQRNFVMVPLAEIAGDFIHPEAKEKISILKEQTNDSLKVECITTISQ